MRKKLGQTKDITFSWVTKIDPELEQWRSLAEEYLTTVIRDKYKAIMALGKFLSEYLHKKNISKVPAEFLNKNYSAESLYEACYSHFKTKKHIVLGMRHTENFINWVLKTHFSVEDDMGYLVIPSEYHNPITADIPTSTRNSGLSESDKNPLPYRYIKQLRTMLVPMEALSFRDLTYSQNATDSKRNGGDWYIVDHLFIDKNDPDCVWRERTTSKYEREKKALPDIVYELWSPVRTVAMYIKLLLPLRTYQVRMLDSGETDTYRYDQPLRNEVGQWTENTSSIKEGTETHQVKRGIFRKFKDPVTSIEMTGFYINTNKTADIDKEEHNKGYEVPWQYEEVLYWLAKLRNWQEKYNPIDRPTLWTQLELNHIGHSVDISILRQMGATSFLFRDPASGDQNIDKPLRETALNPLWHKLLLELEKQCNASQEIDEGAQLKFVKNKHTTLYPLHSLRVSLITAYALEGGVPMPILSKCIAGHSRLIMTLYYTKAGITYVSDMMNKAEKLLAEKEQVSYERWLKDATYKQLEAYSASNDPVSLQAVLNAQQSGASLIKDDKGICPKACLGCDTGYISINEDSGGTSIQPVPGYPEQNCVRCRWFITGPAFLPGLVHHFNVIGYNIGENAERLIQFEKDIEQLEDMKLDCEQNNRLFTENEKLIKIEKLHQQELQKNDKLANDYSATLRLIDRSIAVSKKSTESIEDDHIKLVAAGEMDDIKFMITEETDKLFQLQTLCNGAEIYPETDASKAVLQRSQIIDLTLAANEKKPMLFTLPPELQLIAGNAWMRMLINRAGSLKDAVPYLTTPYAEGRKQLAEIGLGIEFDEALELQQQVLIPHLNNGKSRIDMLVGGL